VLLLAAVAARAGQGGSRLNGNARPRPGGWDRPDDDRFWQAGLLYVNRDDPAYVVAARFGAGCANHASRAGVSVDSRNRSPPP
jgi:uncharacterized membrane protein